MGTFNKKIGDNISKWNNFKGNHLKRFLSHDLPWAICSVVWKKESLIKLGGFNEEFSRLQDVELHTKALINSYNYKTYSSIDLDCFYRIDNLRIKNYMQYCLDDINAKINFINFFNGMLINKIKKIYR